MRRLLHGFGPQGAACLAAQTRARTNARTHGHFVSRAHTRARRTVAVATRRAGAEIGGDTDSDQGVPRQRRRAHAHLHRRPAQVPAGAAAGGE